MAEVSCPNCDAKLSAQEISEGWCETCGKKIPPYALAGVSGTGRAGGPVGATAAGAPRPAEALAGLLTVQYAPPSGCLVLASGLFTFGLVPLYLHFHKKQLPAQLAASEMVLRNGRRIAWDSFTRLKATNVYYGSLFLGTRYELYHTGGKVTFSTDRIKNSSAVVECMLARLPRQVVAAQ